MLCSTSGEFYTNLCISKILAKNLNCTLVSYNKFQISGIRLLNSFYLVLRSFRKLRQRHTLIYQFPPKIEVIPTILVNQILGPKPIAIVHDLDHLRGIKNTGLYFFRDKYGFGLLKKSFVILHKGRMWNYLVDNGITPVGEIRLWPHLINPSGSSSKKVRRSDEIGGEIRPSILYAGNLNPEKASFIFQLGSLKRPVSIYGEGHQMKPDSNITLFPSFKPESPPQFTHPQLGLIWDGDSMDSLIGTFGEYNKINLPAKLSLYIALGIPIVASSQSGIAAFIKETGIGICVTSLDKIPMSFSDSEWRNMELNCKKMQRAVTHGDSLLGAFDELVTKLFAGKINH